MKSDIIMIDNQGNGFEDAVRETKRVAAYMELGDKDFIQLQLCAEEMLSLIRSVTGETSASFWIECEGARIDLHMTTKTVMDKEKRSLLIAASTSRKNEAAKSFLGKLRDIFERAMTSDVDHSDDYSTDMMEDMVNREIELKDPEWDGYEQSILRKVADSVKIGIKGGLVEMTVSRTFDK